MPKIEIYSLSTCPYCINAKKILSDNGFRYIEYDVRSENHRNKMRERTNGKTTVPQIFIDGVYIGGNSDLVDLEKKGCVRRLHYDPIEACLRN